MDFIGAFPCARKRIESEYCLGRKKMPSSAILFDHDCACLSSVQSYWLGIMNERGGFAGMMLCSGGED